MITVSVGCSMITLDDCLIVVVAVVDVVVVIALRQWLVDVVQQRQSMVVSRGLGKKSQDMMVLVFK